MRGDSTDPELIAIRYRQQPPPLLHNHDFSTKAIGFSFGEHHESTLHTPVHTAIPGALREGGGLRGAVPFFLRRDVHGGAIHNGV